MEIRNAGPADAERLREIYSYYMTETAVTFDYDTPSADDFRDKIRKTSENYPFIVAEKDGCVIGYAYAGIFKDRAAYDWSCEVSIYIDRNIRRQGYGRALYRALEERLKEKGVLNLYACVGSPTEEDEYLTYDSERFHSRLGYKKVGEFHSCGYKFGRWYNMIWMEKIIGEHESGQ